MPRNWSEQSMRKRLTLAELEPMLAEAEAELRTANRYHDPHSRDVREVQHVRNLIARRVEALKGEEQKRKQEADAVAKESPIELANRIPRGWG